MRITILILTLFASTLFPQKTIIYFNNPSGYNKDAKALFNRLSVEVSEVEKERVSSTCECFKDSLGEEKLSNWADLVYGLAGETREISKLNWVEDVYNLTEVDSPISWVQYEGFTGNGSSQRLETDYDESIDTNNTKRNSVSIGYYSRTHIMTGFAANGSIAGSYCAFGWLNQQYYARINSSTTSAFGYSPTTRGFWMATRTDNVESHIYRDGILISDVSSASTGTPNTGVDFNILATNNTNSTYYYNTLQTSFYMVTRGLTSDEVRKVSNCIEEIYMGEKGVGGTPDIVIDFTGPDLPSGFSASDSTAWDWTGGDCHTTTTVVYAAKSVYNTAVLESGATYLVKTYMKTNSGTAVIYYGSPANYFTFNTTYDEREITIPSGTALNIGSATSGTGFTRIELYKIN